MASELDVGVKSEILVVLNDDPRKEQFAHKFWYLVGVLLKYCMYRQNCDCGLIMVLTVWAFKLQMHGSV